MSADGPVLTEHRVGDGDAAVTLLIDEPHLKAHLADLRVSFERLLALAAAALAPPAEGAEIRWLRSEDRDDGRVVRWIEAPEIVGLTGLVPANPAAFWGYRRGRTIPSHLVEGEKQPTHQLTLFGERRDDGRVQIYTLYPGDPAPREIHDPRIPLDELDEAIAFWAAHALVVRPGDYTLEPEG